MKTSLNNTTAAILETLVADLAVGESRKIDNATGAYMAVHIERIGDDFFSIAHYGEQNGDLMADPEIVFWRTPLGKWQPASITQHYVGRYAESVVFKDGTPVGFRPALLDDLCGFSSLWMKNIKEQQGLKVRR